MDVCYGSVSNGGVSCSAPSGPEGRPTDGSSCHDEEQAMVDVDITYQHDVVERLLR